LEANEDEDDREISLVVMHKKKKVTVRQQQRVLFFLTEVSAQLTDNPSPQLADPVSHHSEEKRSTLCTDDDDRGTKMTSLSASFHQNRKHQRLNHPNKAGKGIRKRSANWASRKSPLLIQMRRWGYCWHAADTNKPDDFRLF
jgi:hypothetical protein